MTILDRSSYGTLWRSLLNPLLPANGSAIRHGGIQFHEGDGIMLFCAMPHVNIVIDITIKMGMMLSWD